MSLGQPDVLVRAAARADLAAVDRLLAGTMWPTDRSAFKHASPAVQARVRTELRAASPDPTEGLLVAVVGDQVVGVISTLTAEAAHWPSLRQLRAVAPLGLVPTLRFLLAAALSYPPRRHEAYLFGMAVDPAYRRRGIGELLHQAAEEDARARGKRVAVGFVARDNVASLGLLEKRGFERERQRSWRASKFLRLNKTLD
jgi:ribosomal protein S18 acetylase RimI-like enzyme